MIPEGYSQDFLACRDLRHPWQAVGYYRAGSEVRRRLYCVRCGAVRIDMWRASTAERLGSMYSHAGGYKIKGGTNPTEVRKEVLGRVVIFGNEDEMVSSSGVRRKRRGA